MKSFLLVQAGLTLFSIVRCDYTVKRYEDVYNGEKGSEVQPGGAPYQAAVLISGEFSGSAVIISKDFALATCVYLFDIYPDNVELRVGSVDRHSGGEVVRVHDFFIHPDYNYGADNDIALIRLERELEFSDTIQPIPLATRRPEVGEKAKVSGWGYGLTHGSTILHETEMTIMDDKECNATSEGVLTERMICANNRTTFVCDNDFGDALVVNDTLLGLYVGGLLHCHKNNILYTSVPKHLDFVNNIMLSGAPDDDVNATVSYIHVTRLNATEHQARPVTRLTVVPAHITPRPAYQPAIKLREYDYSDPLIVNKTLVGLYSGGHQECRPENVMYTWVAAQRETVDFIVDYVRHPEEYAHSLQIGTAEKCEPLRSSQLDRLESYDT